MIPKVCRRECVLASNKTLNILHKIILFAGEFDANRPVPFRLTPNISEFISAVGVEGVMTGAIIAAARTLVQPQFSIQSILRPIIRDEMMTWYKKVRHIHLLGEHGLIISSCK